jgi:hypothetical protein
MRATLDRLISIGGLLLAVVLLVAGGLLVSCNCVQLSRSSRSRASFSTSTGMN